MLFIVLQERLYAQLQLASTCNARLLLVTLRAAPLPSVGLCHHDVMLNRVDSASCHHVLFDFDRIASEADASVYCHRSLPRRLIYDRCHVRRTRLRSAPTHECRVQLVGLHRSAQLTLFRVNRALVALHHRSINVPSASSSSSRSPTSTSVLSCQRSDWAAAAWWHTRLSIIVSLETIKEPLPDHSNHAHASLCARSAPPLTNIDRRNQAAHICRLVLAATPHLRHLHLDVNTRGNNHVGGMIDTLDMLPDLRSLVIKTDATSCTDQCELYIPLSHVLNRHPHMHALQCNHVMALFSG